MTAQVSAITSHPGFPGLIFQELLKRDDLQKRFYILFVARGDDGQLRKISIPVQYLYIFVVGAAIGFLSLTGIASSYARMLFKVSRYNELRTEKEQLKDRYSRLSKWPRNAMCKSHLWDRLPTRSRRFMD